MTIPLDWQNYTPVNLSETARYPDPLELLLKKPRVVMLPETPSQSDRNLGVAVFIAAFVVTPCLFFYAVYVCLERLLG